LKIVAQRYDAVSIGDEPTANLTLEVSCDFLLGVRLDGPPSGRLFHASECAPGSEEHRACDEQGALVHPLRRRPQIVGKTILLNRRPFAVVGITPAKFSGQLRGIPRPAYGAASSHRRANREWSPSSTVFLAWEIWLTSLG
jgi:hypothetical protein